MLRPCEECVDVFERTRRGYVPTGPATAGNLDGFDAARRRRTTKASPPAIRSLVPCWTLARTAKDGVGRGSAFDTLLTTENLTLVETGVVIRMPAKALIHMVPGGITLLDSVRFERDKTRPCGSYGGRAWSRLV